KLVFEIKENFQYEKLHLIFAVLSDKDAKKMLQIIWSITDNLIITESKSFRRYPYEKLYILAKKVKKEMKVGPPKIFKRKTISNSIDLAMKFSKENDLIC
ncbi:unnamed protein product, partial [marine sediment metagenome]